jgi:hypothetical protein
VTKRTLLVPAAVIAFVAVIIVTSNRVSDEMAGLVSERLRSCAAIQQEFGPLEAINVKLFPRNGSTQGDISQQSFSIVAVYTTEKIDLRVQLEGNKSQWKLVKLVPQSGPRRFEQLLQQCLEAGAVEH